MALKDYRKFADDIIDDFPQLKDDINEAWNTMQQCIKDGEDKENEEDLFYWYINKLKRNLAGEI